jgi:hypothetical protein
MPNIQARDAVHGLGLVTLYSAYAEEGLDNLLEFFSASKVEPFDDKKRQFPITRRLEHALKVIERLDRSEREVKDLSDALKNGHRLFERREELIHGRIYANYDRPDILKSARPNEADTEVGLGEFDALVEAFRAYLDILMKRVALCHAIEKYRLMKSIPSAPDQ